MAENEDLSLSLSLSLSLTTSRSRSPLKPALFPSLGAASNRCSDDEEEAGVCSPASTLLGPSAGKRSDRAEEINEGEEDGCGYSKKLRLSKDQTVVLEESFKENSTLNPKQKQALAKQLNLRPRQVEVWFQNRRARTKLKQTEVECEYMKRWCQNLAEENKRLQEEVMELRAAMKKKRVSSTPTAHHTNLTSSSPSLQLLHGHNLSQHCHLNVSTAANSIPWLLYFPQGS